LAHSNVLGSMAYASVQCDISAKCLIIVRLVDFDEHKFECLGMTPVAVTVMPFSIDCIVAADFGNRSRISKGGPIRLWNCKLGMCLLACCSGTHLQRHL
jgi:hypothetical protein